MATDTPPAQAGLTGQVLFYANPEPLDAERHGKLGMNNSDSPYSFAAGQHFVPLHVGEFGPAAVHYPIIFSGDDRTPIAVMGTRQGENLFIAPDGSFRLGVYVPSFIRRYPFVGARDEQAQRMIICIDRDSSLWTENNPDVRLFDKGEPTEFTKNCIEFCAQFDRDRMVTESFVQLLKDLDLFIPQQTNFTPRNADGTNGEPLLVAEYFAVSVEKVNALPADKLVEMRDNGALNQIYCHLTSQFGWDRIVLDSMARTAAAAPVAANA